MATSTFLHPLTPEIETPLPWAPFEAKVRWGAYCAVLAMTALACSEVLV